MFGRKEWIRKEICGMHRAACTCPNCGGEEFRREFHVLDGDLEVFCAKCGFVFS